MPEGRDGGRGGKPFSRATSSRNTWFSARSAVIVACCASSASRRAALSDRNRRTSTTSTPTRSRSSASERASSDAVSGSDMRPVDHATAPSATSTPRNLLRLLKKPINYLTALLNLPPSKPALYEGFEGFVRVYRPCWWACLVDKFRNTHGRGSVMKKS